MADPLTKPPPSPVKPADLLQFTVLKLKDDARRTIAAAHRVIERNRGLVPDRTPPVPE